MNYAFIALNSVFSNERMKVCMFFYLLYFMH